MVKTNYITKKIAGLAACAMTVALLSTTSASAAAQPLSPSSKATVMESNTYLVLSSSPSYTNLSIDKNAGTIAGYAWSTDIGWIDFTSGLTLGAGGAISGTTSSYNNIGELNFSLPTPGQVSVDDNGVLTGHAWSRDIGWIKFENNQATALYTGAPLDINKEPMRASVAIDDRTGQMSGYGWTHDLGWLDFSGVKVETDGRVTGQATALNSNGTLNFTNNNANVRVGNDGVFSGFAWSNDIGWVNFGGVQTRGGDFPIKMVPGKVTNLQVSPASGGNGRVALTWSIPASDGGSPITDYRIEYCKSDTAGVCSEAWTVFDDGVSTLASAIVTGLDDNQTTNYAFRVSAINEIGVGEASDPAVSLASFLTMNLSADSVTISVTPTSSARFSSAGHSVRYKTNNPSGLSLRLSMNTANNSLSNGAQSITATSASASDPAADLDSGAWGYRVNNATFGNTTVVETNVDASQYKWAKVQPLASPDVIFTTPSAVVTEQALPVYYGVKVPPTQQSGNYTGVVRYEALGN